MTGCFDVGAVEREIVGTRFRGRVMHFDSVGSTNQLALEAAAAGAGGGVWVADEQTAGRGRGGHGWLSAAGDGLYVSALVIPRIPLSHAMRIPLATGLAAQAAVAEATGMAADIRWPNDLMLGERKFGGVLVESSSEAGAHDPKLRFAVIGVGINVNHIEFPTELKELATSLRIQSGRKFLREQILAAFLGHLETELAGLDKAYRGTENGPDIMRRFAEASSWAVGKRVKVGEAEGYTGTTRGLDSQGFLLVEDDDGLVRTVLSGGVRPE